MRLFKITAYAVLAIVLAVFGWYLAGCGKTESQPTGKSAGESSPPAVSQPNPPAQSAPAPSSDIEKGKEVYRAYCAACHGENGDGNSVMANNLNPKPRNFTNKSEWKTYGNDEETVRVIKEGGPAVLKRQSAMPAYKGTLTDAEIKNVIIYIKSLAK